MSALQDNKQTSGAKIRTLSAAIFTTIASAISLCLTLRSYHNTTSLYKNVRDFRATIQLAVQVVSTVLGGLQIYALNGIIRFRVNTKLLDRPLRLDSLKFFNAVLDQKFDTDLSVWEIAVLLTYLAAAQVPAAIWAASITPVVTTWRMPAEFETAYFPPPQTSAGNWSNVCRPNTDCGTFVPDISSDLGTFTYLPWKVLTGASLEIIAKASSRSSQPPNRTRLDNTGLKYPGRSYGVGASLGLGKTPSCVDCGADISTLDVKNISYYELGYDSTVSCMFNTSSALTLTAVWNGTDVWDASGSLPNGYWDDFRAFGLSTTCLTAAVANDSRYLYGFLAGRYHENVNQMQCEVTFKPAQFHIEADLNGQMVNVTKFTGELSVRDIDPSGLLRENVFMSLSYASVTLTTQYTSLYGNAYDANIRSVAHQHGRDYATTDDVLRAVEDSIEAFLDALLIAFSAAQVLIAEETSPVHVAIMFNAAKFGQPGYVYAVFAINALLLLGVLLDAGITRFWKRAPLLNIFDLKSAILAAVRVENHALSKAAKAWNGDSADSEAGSVRFQLHGAAEVLRRDEPDWSSEAFLLSERNR